MLRPKHLILLALNFAIWIVNVLSMQGTLVHFSALRRPSVEIIASPGRVKFIIDGTAYANGTYQSTPVQLPLPPGQHKIQIQRLGYRSQTSTILVAQSEEPQKITSTLEPLVDSFHKVVIDSSQPDQLSHVTVSIAQGLEQGPIPLSIDDLVPGTHIIEITSGLWSKNTFRCQLDVPVGTPRDEPIIVSIEPQGKKIKVQGCKKLKD
jgi:hypothetical protein